MLQTAQGFTAGLLQRNGQCAYLRCFSIPGTYRALSPPSPKSPVSSFFLHFSPGQFPLSLQAGSIKATSSMECEKTMKVVGNNINKLTPLEVGFVPLPLGFCRSTLIESAPQEGTCKPQPSPGLPVQLARTAWHEIKRQVGSLSAWSCPQPMSQKLTSLVLEVEA